MGRILTGLVPTTSDQSNLRARGMAPGGAAMACYPMEQLAVRISTQAPGWDVTVHDDYLAETMLVISRLDGRTEDPDFLVTRSSGAFSLRMVLGDSMTLLGQRLSAEATLAVLAISIPVS
jgi:hypothetical protein